MMQWLQIAHALPGKPHGPVYMDRHSPRARTFRMLRATSGVLVMIVCALAIMGPATAQEVPPGKGEQHWGSLFVEVMDQYGTPVPGVQLLAHYRDTVDGAQGKSTHRIEPVTTDFDGLGNLVCRSGRDVVLRIPTRDGSSADVGREVEVPALRDGEGRGLQVTLRLADDAVFRGSVVDRATGRAPAGVTVTPEEFWVPSKAKRLGGFDYSYAISPVETVFRADLDDDARERPEISAEGNFEMSIASWRAFHVLVSAPGYAPAQVAVGGRKRALGLETPTLIRLQRAAGLQVSLVDADEDLTLELVIDSAAIAHRSTARSLHWRSSTWRLLATESPAKGPVTFGGLPPGCSMLLHIKRGTQTLRAESVVTGLPGSTKRIVFDASSHGAIVGVVRGSDGRVAKDVDVTIQSVVRGKRKVGHATVESNRADHSQPAMAHRVKTDAKGRFSMEGLLLGDYVVTCRQGKNPRPIYKHVPLTFESPHVDIELLSTRAKPIGRGLAEHKKAMEEARRKRDGGK